MDGSINFSGTLSGGIDTGGGGSDVTITPSLQSGTKIADYSIDNVPGVLYAPTPAGLTAELPLTISNNVISIDLSDYATQSDISNFVTDSELTTVLEDYTTYQYTESRYTPLATFNAYTISAESHFQRTLTAGTNITIDPVTDTISASGGSSWDYSTSEVNTGRKWIDDIHYIYNLVIPFTTQLTTNNWVKVASITNEVLAIIDARAINTSNYDFTNVVADFDENDGIYVNNRTTVAFTPTHIIVEYIKLS